MPSAGLSDINFVNSANAADIEGTYVGQIQLQGASNGYRERKATTRLGAWEGIVDELGLDNDGEYFTAFLTDCDGVNPPHAARFRRADLSVDDRLDLESGSVFYWFISQEISNGGTVRRVSEITLRRYPVQSKRGKMRAQKKTLELMKFLNPNGIKIRTVD